MAEMEEKPLGVGCFGRQDNRVHACWHCGDWEKCGDLKKRRKRERRLRK